MLGKKNIVSGKKAKYLILHNTLHVIKSKENKEFPKIKLKEIHTELEGNADPCLYCLSTNGKCSLNMTKNSIRQFVPSADSCVNQRFMKISNAVVDKRKIDSENPCKNRVVMCREVGCNDAFWKVNADYHYKNHHPQVKLEDIPQFVRLEPTEIALYKTESKKFQTSVYIQKGKKRKRVKRVQTKSKKKQRIASLEESRS